MAFATAYPEELAIIRSMVGDMPFLVPGIGAQGGDVEKAVTSGKTKTGRGMIINSSRGIICAGNGDNFAAAARESALRLKDEINRYR